MLDPEPGVFAGCSTPRLMSPPWMAQRFADEVLQPLGSASFPGFRAQGSEFKVT